MLLNASYTEKDVLYRLHFDYKNCISLTKVAFGLQKLRFVYKYLLVRLQSCISTYKTASRFAIELSRIVNEIRREKLKRINYNKAQKIMLSHCKCIDLALFNC